jgi:GntR family transcriptional regulator, transcriptional repressor for pyruvate dehydrogenase complex
MPVSTSKPKNPLVSTAPSPRQGSASAGPAVVARHAVFGPVGPNTAVDLIVRRLGEAIGSGVLERGERLPNEIEVAEQMGVAPMTVRQALAILREAGFIETRRGRHGGSFVREDAEDAIDRIQIDDAVVSQGQLRDLTDWRRAVSGEAAYLAAERCTTDDARALVVAQRAAHAALAKPEVYRLADGRLHVFIAELSRSQRLVSAETQVQATLSNFLAALPRTATATRLSDDQHDNIIRAISEHRPDAARAATMEHIEATYGWVIGLRLGHLTP